MWETVDKKLTGLGKRLGTAALAWLCAALMLAPGSAVQTMARASTVIEVP